MKKLVLFIAALLLTVPGFAQVRSHGTRPSTPHAAPRPNGHHYHYPPSYAPHYGYRGHYGYGYGYRTPYYGYPHYYYPNYYGYRGGYVYGGVVGIYGSFGYTYNSYRYIPPPVYTAPPVVYPSTPQYEVVEVAEGQVIVVGDKIITNENGRIVVYKAAPNGQQ
jgi:hypothetical protein